jgi:tetratricopeptide (TPR) repeat protein
MVNTNRSASEITARCSKYLLRVLILLMGFFPAILLAQENKDPLKEKERNDFNELFFEAEKEKSLGNTSEALALYLRLHAIDEENATVSYELARIYANEGQKDEAVYFGERAVEGDPQNEWFLLLLSQIYGGFNMTGQQMALLQKLVALDTANPDYRYELAMSSLRNEETRRSIAHLDTLEKMVGINELITDQKKNIYLSLGELENAALEIEKLIEAYPRNMDYYGTLAQLYRANGFDEEAYNIFREMMKINPEDPRVHLDLAQYYRDLNQFDSSLYHLTIAVKSPDLDIDQKVPMLLSLFELSEDDTNLRQEAYSMLRAVVEQNTDNPRAYALYGDFLSRDGMDDQALAAYKTAVRLEGGNKFQIWEQILLIEVQRQYYDSLLVDAPRVVELFPNQPLPYLFAGIAHLFNEDAYEAAGYFEDGLTYVLGNNRLKEQFYSQLATAYHELGEHDKSDGYFERTLALNRNNPTALNNYAYFLSVRGKNLDKALEMSKMSNQMMPNNPTFLDTWAWILYQQEKHAEALQKIQEALAAGAEKNPEILEHYGDILLKNGKNKEAVAQFRKAQANGGNESELEKKINAIDVE